MECQPGYRPYFCSSAFGASWGPAVPSLPLSCSNLKRRVYGYALRNLVPLGMRAKELPIVPFLPQTSCTAAHSAQYIDLTTTHASTRTRLLTTHNHPSLIHSFDTRSIYARLPISIHATRSCKPKAFLTSRLTCSPLSRPSKDAREITL